MTPLRSSYGPCALVTGAGAGIGEAFAHALAAAGFELVLVDVDAVQLERVATALSTNGATVRCITADLTDSASTASVLSALEDARVGLLICNAGISHLGSFVDVPVIEHQRALALNCGSTLRLTHAAARRMATQRRGGIVIISSNSGLFHSPYVANYAATKAYGLALGDALYEELRHHGVDVLTVLPGLTRTPGLVAAGLDEAAAGRLVGRAEDVAEGTLRALGHTPRFTPNPIDRAAAGLQGLLPLRAVLALNALSMRRLFPRLGR